jgi:hypothetical protein
MVCHIFVYISNSLETQKWDYRIFYLQVTCFPFTYCLLGHCLYLNLGLLPRLLSIIMAHVPSDIFSAHFHFYMNLLIHTRILDHFSVFLPRTNLCVGSNYKLFFQYNFFLFFCSLLRHSSSFFIHTGHIPVSTLLLSLFYPRNPTCHYIILFLLLHISL